jgi:hypothetical protein
MLLTDIEIKSTLQVIEEGSAKNNHCPKVRGLFQRADEANQNRRVYPHSILETQVKKLQPLIKERRLCGELDHPQNDTVRLLNASHLVTKLWMEGSEVYGEAEILNTPNGKVAQALINDGVKIGISSRGLGTLSEDHITGQKTVNEDYNLVTFDLVADPSTRGAHPSISEGKILEEAKYERTLQEAVSERVFITALKNKLYEESAADKKKRLAREKAKIEKNLQDAGDDTTPAQHLPYDQEEADDAAKRARKKAREQGAKHPPADYGHMGTATSGTAKAVSDSVSNNLTNTMYRVLEDAYRGYPGKPGGSKAAKKEARRRRKINDSSLLDRCLEKISLKE